MRQTWFYQLPDLYARSQGFHVFSGTAPGKGANTRVQMRNPRNGVFTMLLIARRLLLPLLALCAAMTAPLLAGAAPYKVDRSHAFVHFEVTHLGILPYPGRFKQFRVELDYDPALSLIHI